MKAITISVVHNGYLVQGYPPPSARAVYEPPLPNNLYVFTKLEDLQEQLPELLKSEEFEVKQTHDKLAAYMATPYGVSATKETT